MLDRASTFANPDLVGLLKENFVPVALDQASSRRQQDTEGDFYRRIVLQRSRFRQSGLGLTKERVKAAISATTQGFYIATAAGDMLLYNNNRDPEKVLRLMREKLAEFNELGPSSAAPLQDTDVDKRYGLQPPEQGLVIRVQAKVLGGYPPTDDPWQQIFQSALSRDNLWVTADEHQSLVAGQLAPTLVNRIARFHLVDNTRGEPLMWKNAEIKHAGITIEQGKLTGRVALQSAAGDRGYEAKLMGEVEVVDGKVKRFDVVALGDCWGEGPYTKNPPPGKFPLAISFTLADGQDMADTLIPQGARGWADGYLRN